MDHYPSQYPWPIRWPIAHPVRMWYACFVTLDTVPWPQFQAAWCCNGQWGKCLIECCSLVGALPGGFGFHGFKWGWEVVYLPILLQVEYWSCWSYSFRGRWASVTSCNVEVLSNHNLQSVPSQHNKFRSFQCRPMCLMLLLHWVWWQEGSVWDLIFVPNHFYTPISQSVTNRLILRYSMGLIASQPAKWTDPDQGEFKWVA